MTQIQNVQKKIGDGQDFLLGYAEGEQFLIENTVEQIAAFILKFEYESVKITNGFDVLEIETLGGFINYCKDQQFLAMNLIPLLAPMQMGQTSKIEFVPYVAPESIKK